MLRVRRTTDRCRTCPASASLGLGYWEERVDGAIEPTSTSGGTNRPSLILDQPPDLRQARLPGRRVGSDELGFYIVLVPPTPDNVRPDPDWRSKKPGDRIYLGPKVASRYTLAPVTDPADTVVFLSTGTGGRRRRWSPNCCAKGHHGPIVSAVSVRQ